MSATNVIIVPLIGKGNARAAVNIGLNVAASRKAILKLLYLSEKEESPSEIIARFGLVPEDLFNAVVQQICCNEDDFIKTILDTASQPEVDMLIFSDGDDTPFITKSLVEKISCPVLLIQSELVAEAGKPIKNILVAIDCTPSSAAAIEPAVHFAELTGADLHVLHITTMGSAKEPGSLPIGPYMDQPQYDWPLWIREFWDRFIVSVKEKVPQVVPHLHISTGDLDKEILRLASELRCDLVTMTSNTNTELMYTLMSKLACPLLLVQPGKETIETFSQVRSTTAG
jgi:nucleotide-binding universal stress UspA family protein